MCIDILVEADGQHGEEGGDLGLDSSDEAGGHIAATRKGLKRKLNAPKALATGDPQFAELACLAVARKCCRMHVAAHMLPRTFW